MATLGQGKEMAVTTLLLISLLFNGCNSFTTKATITSKNVNFTYKKLSKITPCSTISVRSNTYNRMSSDWSDFSFDENDEDSPPIDMMQYADENDPQELKAEVGSSLPTPEVLDEVVDPIFVPVGTQLEYTYENVLGLLAACREEIGTMFGYTAENRGVGITGAVDFVDLDGPIVILKLKGRFWHQRPTVLNRVGAYIMGRIPEIIDVTVEDEAELSDEVNNAAL